VAARALDAVEPIIFCEVSGQSAVAAQRKRRHRRRNAAEGAKMPRFATEAEREFARLLDFYHVAWEYEPRAFDLRWGEDGRVVERFSPDFYLVDMDLFVELTTMKQSLVTRKNRKLRLMRELYPDVRVKLLYNRDIRTLFAKYDLSPGL
jgi:hypoxanthine phosphoribosyltransferase